MQTILNNVLNELEIKKSKFITLLYQVDNLNEITKKIENAKNEYKDASHYCYAYILDTLEKSSDDGEPSKTAGVPMLNILKQNKLNHVLVIVIRYYGGIKLGAGGLIRSYGNSVKEALNKTSIVPLIYGYQINITTTYEKQKQLDKLLETATILGRTFKEDVVILANVSEDIIKKLDEYNITYEKLEKIAIKKVQS